VVHAGECPPAAPSAPEHPGQRSASLAAREQELYEAYGKLDEEELKAHYTAARHALFDLLSRDTAARHALFDLLSRDTAARHALFDLLSRDPRDPPAVTP
jgi:hypothetical protein